METTTLETTANPEDFAFPLTHIYFYLTEECNLNCRHCWLAPRYRGDDANPQSLDLGLFKSVLEQARALGIVGVKLTGGEPTIHPGINEILGYIRDNDLTLGVETNGVNCTKEIARGISRCKDAFVAVSLDGANAETHERMRGVKGCFVAAIKGIQNLVQVGLSPQIIMSVCRSNKNEMEDLVRLAETLGASSVKFNIVQPTGRGEKMHLSGEVPSIEELLELGSWVDTELCESSSIPIIYGQPVAFRQFRRLFSSDRRGCDVCRVLNILGVLADGSYALCGIGEQAEELVFGHSAKDSLCEVWLNSAVLNELRIGLTASLEGVCSGCVMKRLCRGNCIAQNYYRTRNLWAPFWYCEEALKAGLFPATRIVSKDAPG
jgi:SynChlorMet cassette radical SAM/SPASM protein ScmF